MRQRMRKALSQALRDLGANIYALGLWVYPPPPPRRPAPPRRRVLAPWLH